MSIYVLWGDPGSISLSNEQAPSIEINNSLWCHFRPTWLLKSARTNGLVNQQRWFEKLNRHESTAIMGPRSLMTMTMIFGHPRIIHRFCAWTSRWLAPEGFFTHPENRETSGALLRSTTWINTNPTRFYDLTMDELAVLGAPQLPYLPNQNTLMSPFASCNCIGARHIHSLYNPLILI